MDERALDFGFQALDRATADGEHELDAFRKGIEAYEAAKWRPIEEAPRDGSTIQIQSEKLKRPFPLFANWEDADWGGPGFRVGVCIFEIGSAHLRGAMFRTIDPPTQDADCPSPGTPKNERG